MCVSENSIDNVDNTSKEKLGRGVPIMRHPIPFAQKYKDLFIGILALLIALALFELILTAPLM
jgi:hypothetical protein